LNKSVQTTESDWQ